MNELDLRDIIKAEHKEFCDLHYRITMSDNSKWDVPLWLIIINRAEYYAMVDEISIEESINEDTIPMFKGDTYEIQDWATGNMNWSEVEAASECVCRPDTLDFQDEWCNPSEVEIG